MATSKTCAREDCHCQAVDNAVERDGQAYCSEACARGEGCDHEGCGCGSA